MENNVSITICAQLLRINKFESSDKNHPYICCSLWVECNVRFPTLQCFSRLYYARSCEHLPAVRLNIGCMMLLGLCLAANDWQFFNCNAAAIRSSILLCISIIVSFALCSLLYNDENCGKCDGMSDNSHSRMCSCNPCTGKIGNYFSHSTVYGLFMFTFSSCKQHNTNTAALLLCVLVSLWSAHVSWCDGMSIWTSRRQTTEKK